MVYSEGGWELCNEKTIWKSVSGGKEEPKERENARGLAEGGHPFLERKEQERGG